MALSETAAKASANGLQAGTLTRSHNPCNSYPSGDHCSIPCSSLHYCCVQKGRSTKINKNLIRSHQIHLIEVSEVMQQGCRFRGLYQNTCGDLTKS